MEWDEELHPLLNKLRDAFKAKRRHYIRANSSGREAILLTGRDAGANESIEVSSSDFSELVQGGILEPETRGNGSINRSVLTWDQPEPDAVPSTLINQGNMIFGGSGNTQSITINHVADVAKLRDEILDAIKAETVEFKLEIAELLDAVINAPKASVRGVLSKGVADMLLKVPDAALKFTQLMQLFGVTIPQV